MYFVWGFGIAFNLDCVHNVNSLQLFRRTEDLYRLDRGMVGKAVQRDYRFINKSNGKEQTRNFGRGGNPPDFSLDQLRKSEVRIHNEFTRTLDDIKLKKYNDTLRYD